MTIETTTKHTTSTRTPRAARPRPRSYTDPDYYADPRNATLARSILYPQFGWRDFTEAAFQRQQIAAHAAMQGPLATRTLLDVLSSSPTVSPGVATALAAYAQRTALPPEMISEILSLDAQARAAQPELTTGRNPSQGSSGESGGFLAQTLGGITRPLFALASMPYEMLIGTVRSIVADITTRDPQYDLRFGLGDQKANPIEQSYGGQLISGVFNPELSADMGDGFVPRGDVQARQIAATRSAAPLVHGHAWTLGRGVASMIYEDPDSLGYRNLSGLLDLTAAVAADPLVIFGKAGAAARAIRVGASQAARRELGQATAAAVTEKELGEYAAAGAEFGRQTEVVGRATLDTAAAMVQDNARVYAEGMAAASSHGGHTELANLLTRRDQLLDTEDILRATPTQLSRVRQARAAQRQAEAELPGPGFREREQMLRETPELTEAERAIALTEWQVGRNFREAGQRAQLRATAAGRPQAATDAALVGAVNEMQRALGDAGLDAMTAKITADAPDLPGVFTDAIHANITDAPRALPGSDNGVDAVVLYDSAADPVLRSVDDPIDNVESLTAALTASRRGRSTERQKAIERLIAVANHPEANYGDLLSEAIASGTATGVYNWLRKSDIDGVTDIFRLTGGEAGVWWTTPEIRVARWSEQGWRLYDNTAKGLKERITAAKTERAEVTTQIAAARKRVSATNAVVRSMANTYVKAVDKHTSVVDSYEAIRYFADAAYGVVRTIDGTPHISYDLLRKALFGPTKDFDAAMGVGDAVPGLVRAGEIANRFTTGLMTAGVSEVVRAVGRRIEPFTANTRAAVFDAMVKLTDTPANLGRLQRLTSGKIDPELLKAILRSENEEQVLEVLGPALGLSITRPIGPDVLNAARLRLNSVSGGNNRIWHKATRWMVETAERQSTIAPRFGVHLNFADPQGSAELFRNYLDNLPGLDVDATDAIIGRYLSRETEVGRAREVRRAMDTVADEIAGWTANKWNLTKATADALRDAMKLATRTHEGGRAKVNDWYTERYAHDAHVGYMTSDGGLVHLVGPQLEAELSRGGLVLPNAQAIRDAAGRWGKLLNAHPGVKSIRNAADTGMDFWRSSVLFRYAYIVRNVAEMQFRMFLTGHSSIFNDPLGALAMASAMNKKTRFSRGWFGHVARYNRTATGKELGAVDDAMLESTDNLIPEYLEVIQRTTSHHDMRSVRGAEAFHDVVPVGVDQPGFVNGWAEQIIALAADPLARVVAGYNPPGIREALARGVDRETAVVDWVLTSPAMKAKLRNYQEAGASYNTIFSDPVALRAFLFDSSQGGRRPDVSIRARVMEYSAGGNPELLGLIAAGQLRKGDDVLFAMSSRHKVPEIRQELISSRAERLARALRPYLDELPDDYELRMRVLRGGNTAPGVANRIFNWFFSFSGRKENAWAMGPEFSYAYNDALVELMPSMLPELRQEVFNAVRSAEGRFRPHSETMVKARAALRARPGTLNMEDVEKVAAARASEHVKTLFYDAQQRKQIFHSLRLVMPFAQPFFNTLYSWGRLLAARPYMMEKIGRLATGLTEPGSGVIYDDFDAIDPFTDRTSRDPTQGFIYNHPETGEAMFSFPLIGSILGAALSPFVGFNVAESMQLAAPVQNLNLAFQGDVDYLPGVGPLISIPTSLLMPDDWYGSAPEWFREYVFPFGEPRLEGGLVESISMPSWARRLTGALYNESFRSYSYRGMLAYFASNKDYPNLAGDPRAQRQLVDDVQLGSKILTFVRAVGAAFLPAAPTQEIYAADKDGNLIGSVYLAHHFNQLRSELDGDYEGATQAFVDIYGMQALAAIVPVSEGEPVIYGPGWEFIKEHGKEAEAYADVIGWFFPGDFSYDAYQWSINTGARERLSVEERTDRLMGFLYNARRTQLEGRAATEGWDADAMDVAEEDLKDSFGNVLPQFQGEDAAAKLARIRRALEQFDDLADTRGGQGAMLLFDAYDRFDYEADQLYDTGLTAQRASSLREAFLDELDMIVDEYGGFNDKEGSVENIARYFRSAVTPRS